MVLRRGGHPALGLCMLEARQKNKKTVCIRVSMSRFLGSLGTCRVVCLGLLGASRDTSRTRDTQINNAYLYA